MTATEKQALGEVFICLTPHLFLLLMLIIKSFDSKEDDCYSGMSHEARKEYERYAKYLEEEEKV